MAIPLNIEMRNILGEHVAAGDRIAYYTQLSDWGYRYADLALSVVQSDTLGGRTANAYFLSEAADEGIS
jgi:hypothetical protein